MLGLLAQERDIQTSAGLWRITTVYSNSMRHANKELDTRRSASLDCYIM